MASIAPPGPSGERGSGGAVTTPVQGGERGGAGASDDDSDEESETLLAVFNKSTLPGRPPTSWGGAVKKHF